MKMSVKLYCSWFCPFAQRAWIALTEKGVSFEYVEVDPYDKNPEFMAKNPRGLVPIIENCGKCVYESAVCIEYVDEAWKNTPLLLPTDAFGRAKNRIWSDFIVKKIVPPFYQILMKEDKVDRENAKEALLKALLELSSAMDKDGPFFNGKSFEMVDIMLVPFILRFYILNHYRTFTIPDSSEYDRLRQWIKSASERESVLKTKADRDRLLEKYRRYADDTAETEVATAIRDGKQLP